MFRYNDTNKVSKPREKQIKQVIEVRKVTYVNYDKEGKAISTEGSEIVQEAILSPNSKLILQPQVKGSKVVDKGPTNKIIKPKRF